MKVVKEEEEEDGDLFDGSVCVVVGGGAVTHFRGGIHRIEPERVRIIKFKYTHRQNWKN